MMDQMTGIEFHERLSMIPGGLASRVIFTTGGAYTPAAQEFLSRTTNPCVAKPFNVEALRNQIVKIATAVRNTTAI